MYIILIFLLLSQNVINQNFGVDDGIQKIRQICRSANINYKKTPTANSLNDYLKKLNYDINEEKNNTLDSNLYKLITDDDLSLEANPSEKYLFNITDKYIFNKGVLIFSIFWIGLIISFILGKCIFYKKNAYSYLVSKKYLSWGQIVFLIILFLSSIPFFTLGNFQRAFNASSCTLVRLLQEIRFGKSTYNEGRKFDQPYKWLGLLNLDNVLLDIQNFFNKTGTNRRDVFNNINTIKQNITSFKNEIGDLENFFKNSSIFFYNRKMRPLYFNEFNDINRKGSKINDIHEFYQNPAEINYRHMLNINDTTTVFESKNLIYKKDIEGVYNQNNEFSKFITPKSINITHNIQFLHENAITYIYQYLKYSYILNMAISACLPIFMFFYFRKRTFCFKVILHFGWNFSMIIILISFVVSYFLFSLGASFYHLIYVLCEDIFNVNQNGFFNTCLNKDGNLINLFSPNQVTSFAEFNDFYHLIIRQKKIIHKLEKPELIEGYLKEVKKLKVDITLTTDEEYKFRDTNHLLKRLSEITGDKWVSERFSCKNYRYLGKELMISFDSEQKIDDNYCLTVQDMYSEQDLKKMYKNKDENKIQEIITIVGNLNSYYIQNEEILTKLEERLIKIERIYNDLMREINVKTQEIYNLADMYLTLFPYMTEKESLSEIFNCDILKKELIIYIDYTYNYVYFYCILFGIISLAISILTFLGIIIIINSLWIDYGEKDNEKDEEEELMEEELGEIKEEEGEEEIEEESKNINF